MTFDVPHENQPEPRAITRWLIWLAVAAHAVALVGTIIYKGWLASS